MNRVFVDTAGLIAIGDKGDIFHSQAIQIREKLRTSWTNFITTSAVIIELAGYFSKSHQKNSAIVLIETINRSKKWTCISIDKPLIQRGFERYKQMSDKDWSLVDCIGMIIATDNDITEIFTADHHFEQAGFSILLREAR